VRDKGILTGRNFVFAWFNDLKMNFQSHVSIEIFSFDLSERRDFGVIKCPETNFRKKKTLLMANPELRKRLKL